MQRSTLKSSIFLLACLISTLVIVAAQGNEKPRSSTGTVASKSATPSAEMVVSVAKIHGYGVFVTSKSQRHTSFSKKAVASDVVTGIRFTQSTTRIPARLGTNFGFQYSINTAPNGQRLPIRSIIHFPDAGLQQPGGKHYSESIEYKQVLLGQPELHGYGFDEPWEIVPGQWVFEIWHKDTRLIRKTFTVFSEDANHEE